ncbi:hypothetical protein os4_23250 [Comamonadaceae bacterium OS-4]|nr:hypothetical protein os4_23250 [Comamonadaceae bacterium OS-4]
MKLDFIEEPELEFGGLRRHVDIRAGLTAYGPLDAPDGVSRKIRVGFVGTQQTIDGIQRWLERCNGGIKAKASKQPNLFPDFPGFGHDSPFRAEFETDSSLTRVISAKELRELSLKNHYAALSGGVDLLAREVRAISEAGRPSVVIVAIPPELMDLDDDDQEATDSALVPSQKESSKEEGSELGYAFDLDLRHMLKAEVMKMNQPIQLVLPSTYGDGVKNTRGRSEAKTRLQDEATRAWNFYTALYYKASYRPWRILRNTSDLQTCFVGISFYRSLDKENVMTSMAQVYDQRGEGVIVRGNPVKLSKDDRQPHLSSADAYSLLSSALKEYRREHKHAPARVVLHKSSSYSKDELDGFNRATDEQDIETSDLLVVAPANTRLFREGSYPPLRGTMLSLDAKTHLLYTRGSVPYYSTYPGLYVPRPLKFYIAQGDESPRKLAEEIMALTKLNWNNTQFDGGEPITMRVAHQVGKVLKYVGSNGVIQPGYSFYM